jgi:hypothetical protein
LDSLKRKRKGNKEENLYLSLGSMCGKLLLLLGFILGEMLNVRLLSVSRPSLSSVARDFPPKFESHSGQPIFTGPKDIFPHIFSLHIFSFPEISFPIPGDPPAVACPRFLADLLHFPPSFSGRFAAAACPHFPADLLHFRCQLLRPISSSGVPHFLADLLHFPVLASPAYFQQRRALICRPISSTFRRGPSSPISDRSLPPFSGRSPPFSGSDQAPLVRTELELCPHFRANLLPLPAATELPVSTTDRALQFQRRLISARLHFLVKEALQR